ncbi:YigZ family protein [Rhodobacter calidifons]|uniref:YigZ family protein n=1 Tax=Rhodobacter calidifons TaxID=2715277 RepID=A0ABX0G3Q1_9RHOB|nr:YigZ family protein [Rhodobacter calidifons]NHB75528.1 YigZ family protein [Rhodobacter calidifons]
MIVLENLIRDRGSRYAAAAGTVRNRAEIEAFLATLRRRRKFDRATHHSWAAILSEGGPLKHDDGEAGAGAVILRMLEREAVTDRIVVVTRWYGGVPLGGDRFAHVVTCTRAALAALGNGLDGPEAGR